MIASEKKQLKVSIDRLLLWSKENHQHLPWRKKRTLYGTLVSEIMLQQTTVGTVLNHFEKFMLRFPTIQDLANATHEELAVEWKGLGYYRRAKNLKSCAEEIVANYKGHIPNERNKLLKIKGIGEYTADALIAIGNNEKALAVDANLERVIARLYAFSEEKGLKLQRKIRDFFATKKIFNIENFLAWRDLNEALMDLGRVYCKSKKTYCEGCPLEDICESRKQNTMLQYPLVLDSQTIKDKHELKLLRVIYVSKGKIAVYKKNHNEWLSDQWETPTLIVSSTDNKMTQYPWPKKLGKIDFGTLPSFKTAITKYKITNYLLVVSTLAEIKAMGFDGKIEMHAISKSSNFSTATFKLLKFVKNKN